jgi:hypothetical protein
MLMALAVAYLRFAAATRDSESGVETGLFQVAYRLRDSDEVTPEDRLILHDCLSWFDANLQKPHRFNRTKSKGHYRRNAAGIAWFRDTATECIKRMFAIKEVLEANGYTISLIRTERIGYLVYEDALQVIAEPFAETRTAG